MPADLQSAPFGRSGTDPYGVAKVIGITSLLCMPSFDVVSEVDRQELRNAVDQAEREMSQRFDFKGTNSSIEQKELVITIKVGITSDKAKEINKLIKEKGPKGVSSQTQGEQVRVTSKKRDDLQAVMALLKGEDLGLPLQFENFRD